MNAIETDLVISTTKKWITDVVVGCNFCPFAAREVKRDSIHYIVLSAATNATALVAVAKAMQQLDDDDTIETSFLILPGAYPSFIKYLDLVELAETFLKKEKKAGIYQIASFHPQYLFAGSKEDDPSNYTNRSPYPMLHFLREASVSKAVDSYPDIDNVTKRNIAFTKEKGLAYMKALMNDEQGAKNIE